MHKTAPQHRKVQPKLLSAVLRLRNRVLQRDSEFPEGEESLTPEFVALKVSGVAGAS
jgi:hypothetical protein